MVATVAVAPERQVSQQTPGLGTVSPGSPLGERGGILERNTAIVESEQIGEDLEALESFEGVPKTLAERELVGVMQSFKGL